ncbi:MAG: GYD domain-containing protein [Chloroflexota bacterium]|nr:GYD domain-containing protein [Chloroflexota bacterium]MDE2688779.1 GYD domain-containing protein [Chloroflexota bacterium]
MPKYLFQASYTQEGLQGLLKEGGTQRREVVANLAAALGGSVEAFYYAFGDHDIYVIADLPDDATATAASLVVGASGAGSVKTTVLIPPETVDDAAGIAVNYRPPAG